MKNPLKIFFLLTFCAQILTGQTEFDSLKQLKKFITQTNSAYQIESENFNSGHISQPIQLIQGKTPGLDISRAGDDPNGDYILRMRGLHSVSQNLNPLYLVNGFPAVSLTDIDPNDIKSITVLRDASSGVKYGIRGNNGVIEIRTKSIPTDTFSIQYNTYLALEKVAKYWPVADANQFISFGGNDFGGNTDWQKEISQTAFSMMHNLNFSGFRKGFKYRLSLNYRNANGTVKNTGFERYNGRLFLAQSLMKNRLNLSAELSASSRNNDLGFLSAYRTAVEAPPSMPIFGTDAASLEHGGYFFASSGSFFLTHPLAFVEQNIRRSKEQTYTGNFKTNFKITDELSGFAMGGRQAFDYNRTTYYPDESIFYTYWEPEEQFKQNRRNRVNDFVNSGLKFQKTFGDFHLDLEAGHNYQMIENESVRTRGKSISPQGFSFQNLEENSKIEIDTTTIYKHFFEDKDIHKLAAFYGDLGLQFRNLVYVNAHFRREGSSRLGTENRLGNFYGINGGFNLTKFFKIFKVRPLDFTKIRFGYGKTGNVPNQPYLTQFLFGIQGSSFQNGAWRAAYGVRQNPNPNLGWEEKTESNFGTDFSFFKGRLTGKFNWYQSETGNLILEDFTSLNEPPTLGGRTWVNEDGFKNKGWEFELYLNPIRKPDFVWDFGFHISKNETIFERERLPFGFEPWARISIPGGGQFYHYFEKGKPIGRIFGNKAVEGNPEENQDLNKDGWVCNCDDDYAQIGNGLPEKVIGFSNQIRYKNFDLTLQFRSILGHFLINTFRYKFEHPTEFVNNGFNVVMTDAFIENREQGGNLINDFYVEKASFLRLQNATLGYNLDLKQNPIFREIRFTLTAQNLLTLTNYKGVDPEVRYHDFNENDYEVGEEDFEPNPMIPGADRRSVYLPSRIWTFGVRADF